MGSLFTAIGVGMQVGSSEWKLFLAGRLVNGEGSIPDRKALDEIAETCKLSDLASSSWRVLFGLVKTAVPNCADFSSVL